MVPPTALDRIWIHFRDPWSVGGPLENYKANFSHFKTDFDVLWLPADNLVGFYLSKMGCTMHNVYFVKYDVTVSYMAQVLDTVTYFVSHVLVVDTVTYFDIFREWIQWHILGEITDLEFENH